MYSDLIGTQKVLKYQEVLRVLRGKLLSFYVDANIRALEIIEM